MIYYIDYDVYDFKPMFIVNKKIRCKPTKRGDSISSVKDGSKPRQGRQSTVVK